MIFILIGECISFVFNKIKFQIFALFSILNILILLFYYSLTNMKKNLKQLTAISILSLWLLSAFTFADTKSSCFTIADSQAWFWWAVIVGYQCFDNEITIPKTLDWKPVTEIWKSAFKNTVLISVKLPDSLKQISESAFEDNIIEKLEIPEGVEIIEKAAFKNNNLKALKLPKTLKTIWEEAFYKNKLEKFSVPWRLDKVGENAFCENAWEEVIWVSDVLEWKFKNTCFKLIKASTVENSYEWIETDFSSNLTEKLWTWIKTDSPEVDELTSILKELDDGNGNLVVEDDTVTWKVADDEIEPELIPGSNSVVDADTTDDEFVIGDDFGDRALTGVWWAPVGVKWVSSQGVSWEQFPSSSIFDNFSFLDLWWVFAIAGWFLGFAAIWYLGFVLQTLFLISIWELFKKAWKKWWAFLVPFYNTMVYSEIAESSKWLWLIPWLTPILIFGSLFFRMWTEVNWILSSVLWITNFILFLHWNYTIPKRFWFSTLTAILNVFFTPIVTLFVGLSNNKYQPKKVSYDINNPQVNEPEKVAPAPVVAAEQLNNVVEHFVWPEEESASTTQAQESAPVEVNNESVEEVQSENNSESEAVTLESDNVNQDENLTTENSDDQMSDVLKDEWTENILDSFDNMDAFSDNTATHRDVPSVSFDSMDEGTRLDTQNVNVDLSLNTEPVWEDISEETNLTKESVNDIENNEIATDVDLTINDSENDSVENATDTILSAGLNSEEWLEDLPNVDLSLSADNFSNEETAIDEESSIDESSELTDNSGTQDVEQTVDETDEASENTDEFSEENTDENTEDNTEIPEGAQEENQEEVSEEAPEESNESEDVISGITDATEESTEEAPGEVNGTPETAEESSENSSESHEEEYNEADNNRYTWMFSSADDQNTQSFQEQPSTQDMPIDTSFMKDMPQDVVEDLFKSEQMVEGNEGNTPSENTNDEMPSEPISDLDQLLANNKNS